MNLVEMITSLNEVVQTEDKKIQEQMQKGQKAYQDAVADMKKKVANDSVLSYELGRFVTAPQNYQVPPEHMPQEIGSAIYTGEEEKSPLALAIDNSTMQ